MKMKKKTGFTILELIVAVSIFGIGISSLLAVYTQSVTVSKRSDYAYTAYNLAKNHIERLRVSAFSSLSLALETDTRVNRDGEPDEAGEYLRSTSVMTNYGSDANLTRVDVNVRSEFKKVKSPQPMSLSTVIYNG